MSSLLESLESEITSFTTCGASVFDQLNSETNEFIEELISLEQILEKQVQNEENIEQDFHANELTTQMMGTLKKKSDNWYKKSISSLKTYNSSIGKVQKNITNNPKISINLDEAYNYPLNLDTFPKNNTSIIRQHNQQELTKALVLHLLKSGHSKIVNSILPDLKHCLPPSTYIKKDILVSFKEMDLIVNEILNEKKLDQALAWIAKIRNTDQSCFKGFGNRKNKNDQLWFKELEFKFHILQYALLLNGQKSKSPFSLESAIDAYKYSKVNFTQFFSCYKNEISVLMTLLLLESGNKPDDGFQRKRKKSLIDILNTSSKSFVNSNRIDSYGAKFVDKVFAHFESIESDDSLFIYLANEFTCAYCEQMKLSNDSPIFQAILAGFVNLSNFYKYTQIHKKLGKALNSPTTVESGSVELPFQLVNSKTHLFKYHPIFICPVSKEQLSPLSNLDKGNKKGNINDSKLNNTNPVVVLKKCQHLALRESIWQLSKKGTESFKCHYCYKKHKFTDVSEAYFIDF